MTQQEAAAQDVAQRMEGGTVGEAFALALAAKDRGRLVGLLADQVDFQALTPGRHWVAASSTEAVDEVILGHWLRPDDVVGEVRSVTTGQVADAQRVGYRLAVRRDDTDFVLEQQAYYIADGRQISWIRVLCSGFRPADTPSVQIPADDRERPEGRVG